MRRLRAAPVQSIEILVLESPETFVDALLARPPLADENYLIARDRHETVRQFALRSLRRLRRMLASPHRIANVSYLFSGAAAESSVRRRFLRGLAAAARRGSLQVIGPQASAEAIAGYMDSLSPRLPCAGSTREARFSPTGWAIVSAGARRCDPSVEVEPIALEPIALAG
jgi:hypothetical protein